MNLLHEWENNMMCPHYVIVRLRSATKKMTPKAKENDFSINTRLYNVTLQLPCNIESRISFL